MVDYINGKGGPLRDNHSNSVPVIDYEHHEIHSGSSYTMHFTNTTSNSDDHRTVIGFSTPNTTKYFHLVISITASHDAEFFLYEDISSIDVDEGTSLSVFNRDRNSNKVSAILPITTTETPGTATSFTEAQIAGANVTGGTAIEYRVIVAGDGPKAVGGSSRGSQEVILKKDTIYLLIIQNIGANTNTHNITADWYEHTQGL